jgi:hypothetical protein
LVGSSLTMRGKRLKLPVLYIAAKGRQVEQPGP